MPANRRTESRSSSQSYDADPGQDDDAYRKKRERNNVAVKKTRQKSKETANTRKRNVEHLRNDNKRLEGIIEAMDGQIETLKDLLLKNVDPADHDRMIQQILDEPSDEEPEITKKLR